MPGACVGRRPLLDFHCVISGERARHRQRFSSFLALSLILSEQLSFKVEAAGLFCKYPKIIAAAYCLCSEEMG